MLTLVTHPDHDAIVAAFACDPAARWSLREFDCSPLGKLWREWESYRSVSIPMTVDDAWTVVRVLPGLLEPVCGRSRYFRWDGSQYERFASARPAAAAAGWGKRYWLNWKAHIGDADSDGCNWFRSPLAAADDVRRLRGDGVSVREVAAHFGVSESTVCRRS